MKFVIKQNLLGCRCESDMSVFNGETQSTVPLSLGRINLFLKELIRQFSITIFILLLVV